MKISAKYRFDRIILIVFTFVLFNCGGNKEDTHIIPPVTSPLSDSYVGFGVINVSYISVRESPEEGSPSIGYLRRGSLVRVLERRTIIDNTGPSTWVLTEGNSNGWLREEEMDIYSSESRAKTASENMSR